MSDFFYLPEALLMNIWLRLPIKSTVRFRCVSKSWCASLSDPHFIYKNLTLFDVENQNENENDLLLVLDSNKKFYSVVSHETLVATPLQVSPLGKVQRYGEVLTFSCDDLVCFHNEDGEAIGVWNLTTGDTKILPPASLDAFEFTALGFGFDDKIKDYKVVQIRQQVVDRECVLAVFVYSLRSGNNRWRKLEVDVPESHLGESHYGRCYRDGIFYWCDSDDVIVSFDMSGEVFNTISIPQHPHPLEFIERICKLKDGSMLLISCHQYGYSSRDYDLWALLDVGGTPSLTKLFCIDCHYRKENASPLGFWRNELVFGCPNNRRLLIGDPSKQELKVVQIDGPLDIKSCLAWTKGKNSVPSH